MILPVTALTSPNKKGSDATSEPHYVWWRRGRVELPVQKKLSRIYYKLSQLFNLALADLC